jgi:itaconyl-CoA hydratase
MRVRAGFRLEVSDGTRTRDRLAMFDGGLIESHRLRDLYEPIEPQLYRYPAIDPDAFRRDSRDGHGPMSYNGPSTHRRGRTRRAMTEIDERAPKRWRGRFFEDFDVGDVFRSRLGRTISSVDNAWFTCLTMNTNQLHFNHAFAARTRFGKPLVNSCLTLALVTGLSVPDTSENAAANLSWTDVRLPNPVYEGDTLFAESEVLELRESRSNPSVGIVSLRTRGINQRGQTVIEFRRTFMAYRRAATAVEDVFPEPTDAWAV